MLKVHQQPAVRFMLQCCIQCASERGTGDGVIRIVGWPWVHGVPPRCSSLSSNSPVVGLAQALLSRPWQGGEPVAKEDLVRGGGASLLALSSSFSTIKHHLLPIMRYPQNPPCACRTGWATSSREERRAKYTLKLAQGDKGPNSH